MIDIPTWCPPGSDLATAGPSGCEVLTLDLEVADLGQEAADLVGVEAAVSAEGPHGRDLARPGPAGHGLGVHPEHGRHFGGGEQFVLSHQGPSTGVGSGLSGSLPVGIGSTVLVLYEKFVRGRCPAPTA